MNFLNPKLGPNLDDVRKHTEVVQSHDVPKHAMSKAAQEIRESDGGIHLDNHEVVLVKKMIADQIRNLDKKINELQSSLDNYTAANRDNAEAELESLQEEYRCLRFNLAEKFEK